jgi:alkylated DNA repair dioxygenase AlkB
MDIKFTDLIYHKKNFLTKEECKFLINEFETRLQEATLEKSAHAFTGLIISSSFKKVELLEHTPAWEIIDRATKTIVEDYTNYLNDFNAFHVTYKDMIKYNHAYRLLKYDTGAKIHPHSDRAAFENGSCSFNLNDSYEGGAFSFWNGRHKIQLGQGDALIWPADFFWVHEVEEITKGVRYSTNCFLQSIPENLKKEIYKFVDERIKT